MSAPFVDFVSSFPQAQILGIGRTGLVILREETAVKLPVRWQTSSDDVVQANVESIQHEQDIYRRLGNCDGVVPCLGFSEITTQLAFMKNGDLCAYLTQNQPPKPLQLSWFREMARTLALIHDRRVLVADIASRNFLLDSDLSIKFCDFSESTKFTLDTCMETADDDGYSIQTDIGQLGAVIYEVVAGERCEFDLFKDVPPEVGRATWPRRESLPSTQNVWLSPIIENCWTKGAFRNAHDLLKALESISIDNTPIQRNEERRDLGPPKRLIHAMNYSSTVFKQYAALRPITTTLAVTFGAMAFLATWIWRRSRAF
jgi:serine/threonine protein kinase